MNKMSMATHSEPELSRGPAETGILRRASVVFSLVGIVLAVLWFAPAIVFNMGLAALVVLTTRELYLLNTFSVTPFYCNVGLLAAGLLTIQMFALPAATLGLSIPLVLMVLLATAVIRTRHPSREELQELLWVLFGVLYVAGTLGQLVLIRNSRFGREIALIVIVSVLLREASAHLAGSLFRTGTPLNRSINTRKSYAGAAFSIGLACAAVVFLSRYVNVGFTLFRAILFGVCLGVACQLGDLSESYIKRVSSQRHSGNWLGPEGGLLDFLDAAAFAVVTSRLLLLVWGY